MKDIMNLEKPANFTDLLGQIEFISIELEKWISKIVEINKIARQHREIVSKSDTKDAFHNLSQNIIELSELLQKKLKEV